jgi:DNA-binding MarR family transcriptional regulator
LTKDRKKDIILKYNISENEIFIYLNYSLGGVYMDNKDKFDFGAEMSYMMPALLREVAKRNENIVKGKKNSLNHMHIAILDLLAISDPLRMGEISRILKMTMSNATATIDKMIEDGLVERQRSHEDRRVVEVSLSKKGHKALIEINDFRRDLTNEMYAVLSEKEKKEYLTLLRKVYDELLKKDNISTNRV